MQRACAQSAKTHVYHETACFVYESSLVAKTQVQAEHACNDLPHGHLAFVHKTLAAALAPNAVSCRSVTTKIVDSEKKNYNVTIERSETIFVLAKRIYEVLKKAKIVKLFH